MNKLIMLAVAFCVGLFAWGCTDIEERKAAFVEKGQRLMASGDAVKARLEFKNALSMDDKDADIWYLLGQSEQAAGKLKPAFGAYSRAAELDPTHLQALLKKGQFVVGGGSLEQAEEALAAVTRLAPENEDVLLISAAVKKRRGDLPGAEADIKKTLAKQPDHNGGLAFLAMIQVENNDSAAAERTLRKGVAAHPDDTQFRVLLIQLLEKLGRGDEAIEAVRALIEEKPENATYRIRLARYLAGVDRSDEAEEVLREAVVALPENTEVKLKLIEFQAAVRGLPRAIAVAEEYISAQQDNTELRLALAKLHIAAGESEQAVSIYKDMIASKPESPQSVRAQIQLAALYARLGKRAEARQTIDQALQVSTREPDALILRANLVLEDDPDQAISDLRTVLREYPDRPSVHELLGQAHANKNDYALAQDAFDRAIELEPKRSGAYLKLAQLRAKSGDMDGALAVLKLLLEQVPDDAKAQQAIAQIQLSSSDWEALTVTASQIQKDRPEHALGYYLAGVAAQKQNDHEHAVEALEKALERSPNATKTLVPLAQSLFALKRIDEAKRRVSLVLESKPNDLVALNLLGDLNAVEGKAEQARENYEQAIKFHSEEPRAYLQLAKLLAGEPADAGVLDVLERGLQATDRNPTLLFQLASEQEKRGNTEAAIAAYEELLQRYPDTLLAKNNLAMLLANNPDSEERLDKALQLTADFKDHELPAFRDTLGWVQYQRGEYELAAETFKNIVAKYPQMGEAHYHLAMAYMKLGRSTDAKETLEPLLAKDDSFPSRSEAERLLAQLTGGG